MEAQALVKNEAGPDQRAGLKQERQSDEHEVGEHNQDEDLKVTPFRRSAKDNDGNVEKNERDDELARDQTPDLGIEGPAQRAKNREGCEAEHGQTYAGKERYVLTQCHGADTHEKDQYDEGDAIGIEREKVWRAEKKNRHRQNVKNRREGQGQVQRTKQQAGYVPEAVVMSPRYGSAAHARSNPFRREENAERAQENAQVEAQGPVLDIGEIEVHVEIE